MLSKVLTGPPVRWSLDESPGKDWILADDNLDAPLGKGKKRKTLKLPATLPQVAAGVLGLSIAVVGGWTVLASNPYGGQPIAVVAMGTDGAKDAKAAPAKPGAPAEAAVPPGSKVVT